MGIFGKNDKTQDVTPQSGATLDPSGGVSGSAQAVSEVASAPPPIQEPSPQPVAETSTSAMPQTPVSESASGIAGTMGMEPSAPPAPPDETVGTKMPLPQQPTSSLDEAGVGVGQKADVPTVQESPLSPTSTLASSSEEPGKEPGSGSGTTGMGGL